MSSGHARSRIPVESDSEDAEDAHPVDAVIQAAISRQQSPAPDTDRKGRSIKRKRETSSQQDAISLHSSSDEASAASTEQQGQAAPSASKAIPAAGVVPIGVTVVEEGAQTRNAEVQRLLRGGRQVPHLEFAVIKPGKVSSMLQPSSSDRCTGLQDMFCASCLTALQPKNVIGRPPTAPTDTRRLLTMHDLL